MKLGMTEDFTLDCYRNRIATFPCRAIVPIQYYVDAKEA
jgi:hypothetical protein